MSQVSIIDIEGNNPQVPTRFDANLGFAIPIGNVLEILGDVVNPGILPVYTTGSGNTITTNVQISQAIASSNRNNVGLAAFDSSSFNVDADGFVTLRGGSLAIDSIGVDGNTAPGTDPVLPDTNGLITVTGGQIAAGTTVNAIRTFSLNANEYTIQIQRSQALATATVGANGVCHFDSAAFDVDADGFVTLNGSGNIAIDSVGVDANTAPGTDPVLPDVNGLINVTGAQVAAGTTANVIRTNSLAANAYTIEIQRSSEQASSTIGANGVCHFDADSFNVDSNGFVSLQGGDPAIDTVTGNTGTAVPDANGNLNILGLGETITAASVNTLTIFSPRTAKYIVDPTLDFGTHQTITAALTAASSGETIFVRPGSYTENLTLKAGVNLTAYQCDDLTPNVTIIGNLTATFAGTATISGIRLQTNSANILTISGSSATIINLENCFLNLTNNTGISYTSSSSSSALMLYNCSGNIGTTGITYFAQTSPGQLRFFYCDFANDGLSTTASTASAGGVLFRYCRFPCPITTSGTALLNSNHSVFETNNLNVTAITTRGGQVSNGYIASGTATPISVSAGATQGFTNCSIFSSNSTAISGAGVLEYNDLCFGLTGLNNITTTTRTALDQGTFTPTLLGSTVNGTTTYTTQVGLYWRKNGMVFVQGKIVITGATGTGSAVIGGFPYGIINTTNYDPIGSVAISSATWTWPVGTTSPVLIGNINTTNATISVFGSGTGGNLAMNNSAATFYFSLFYRII